MCECMDVEGRGVCRRVEEKEYVKERRKDESKNDAQEVLRADCLVSCGTYS